MKKIKLLLGLLVIIGVGYCGAVWWSGVKTQERYEEKVAALSTWLAANAPEVKITAQSYERGFFSASSTLALQFDGPSSALGMRSLCYLFENTFMGKAARAGGTDDEIDRFHDGCVALLTENVYPSEMDDDQQVQVQVIVDNRIQHGPWLAGQGLGIAHVQTQLKVHSDTLPEYLRAYIESLQIDTVRHYSRDYDMRIAAPAFSREFDGLGRLDFDGFKLNLVTHDARKRMDYALDMPRFEMQANVGEQTVRVEAVGLSMKSTGALPEKGWLGWLVGDGESVIKRLEVTSTAWPGKWGRCENVVFNGRSHFNGDLYNEKGLGRITCSTNYFDAPLEVKADLDVSMENFNLPWMVNFYSHFVELSLAEYTSADPISASRAMTDFMLQEIPVFLKSEPAYQYKLVLQVNQKPVADLLTEFKGYPINDEEMKIAPYILIPSKVSMRTAYSLDANTLLNGFPEYGWNGFSAEELEDGFLSRVLVRDGDHYRMDFSFDRGDVKINGEKLGLF
ncbi:DUF945 family protein [Saezia sanguinis]|uniref:DUF945 family protein n=1 Tax=Saezia sanguinis TaxID=1965230 RepID=UPI003043BC1D